jgi:glycine/D-amino acid oxidase-like deaminating enzyme
LSTRYGRSPWVDQFPKSRVPSYPAHRGALKRDVVVIGGGLTGCTSAYAFAAAGVNVTLLEATQIGRGTTAASAGWIADEPGIDFLSLEQAVGLRAARHTWQTWRRAALDFSALLRRLEIKCGFDPHGSLTVGFTPEDVARLKREQKARRDAGIEAPFLSARAVADEAALTAAGGLRTKDGATLDPYRASLGMAAAAAQRGAQICERSAVTKVTFNRKWVDVFTAAGTIRTDAVVVATGVPTPLFKSLARHFWFRTSYLALTEPVPAKIRQRLGRRASVIRDRHEPPHLIRWLEDGRLLVGGADRETGPDRLRDTLLLQRTGQLMYELSTMYPDVSGIQPAYGWDTAYARTADGLPYFGSHRNFPRHLFAFGDASPSVTGAYVASRVLLRDYLDEADRADAAFSFTR